MNAADVWNLVYLFAEKRVLDQQPVYTTDKNVRNFIADVKPGSIGRRSDEGTTNASRVTKGQVLRVWSEFMGGPPADVLYFTRALVAAALEDFFRSGSVELKVEEVLNDLKRSFLGNEYAPTPGERLRLMLQALEHLRTPPSNADAPSAERLFGHPIDAGGKPIAIGTLYRDRAELAAGGVHRPLMAGISGSARDGADSIVLSGGYEDDEDLGDVIVYTGHGGQDERTKRQVRDQEFTRGNKALVVSCVEGLPVRVIRGADRLSPLAPTSGYRYDGLFRVDEHWHERGRAGFLMCRFRLVRWIEEVSASVVAKPGHGELAVGNPNPVRRELNTQRIVRNSFVGTDVKRLYDHRCQVCGTRLESSAGAYAEAAHIRGLGRPHNGPDVPSNVLCLCPNHHVLFDLGAFFINDDLTLGGRVEGRIEAHPRHKIDVAHIAYHRDRHAGTARPTSASDLDHEAIAPGE